MCTKLSTVGGAQLQSPQHAMEAQVRAQSTRGTVAVAARKARAAAGAFRAPGTGLMHSELEHDLYFSRPWKCVDFEGRPGGAPRRPRCSSAGSSIGFERLLNVAVKGDTSI